MKSKPPAGQPAEKTPGIFHDGYDARRLWRDLTAGGLRWPATVFVGANVVVISIFAHDPEGVELTFSFLVKVAKLWLLMSLTLAVWFFLAAANWMAWLSQKRSR